MVGLSLSVLNVLFLFYFTHYFLRFCVSGKSSGPTALLNSCSLVLFFRFPSCSFLFLLMLRRPSPLRAPRRWGRGGFAGQAHRRRKNTPKGLHGGLGRSLVLRIPRQQMRSFSFSLHSILQKPQRGWTFFHMDDLACYTLETRLLIRSAFEQGNDRITQGHRRCRRGSKGPAGGMIYKE